MSIQVNATRFYRIYNLGQLKVGFEGRGGSWPFNVLEGSAWSGRLVNVGWGRMRGDSQRIIRIENDERYDRHARLC